MNTKKPSNTPRRFWTVEPSSQIKSFTEEFFKNLKCNLSYQGEVLIVNNVPADFESFLGRKGPYALAFASTLYPGAEPMTKGSFFLKAMNAYLETKGTTTLIKLNFERDYKEEFKHYFKLRNCDIHSIAKKQTHDTITRFTFSTNFQYLNERESVVNDIYLKSGKIISLSLDKYKQESGKKEDLPTLNLREEYNKAKDALRPLLDKRISDTAEILKKRLEREQQRIKEHFSHQKKEYLLAIQKLKNQVIQLEKDIQKSSDQGLMAKRDRVNETIREAESPEHLAKIEKEEQFFLNDEVHKHSLNIDNKLINTSIIYYPIFNFSILLKNNESARQIELVYNPFEDTLNPELSCEVCKHSIQEFFLCSSGHITCNNCYEKCRECSRGLCGLCLKRSCDYCSKKLCKKCSSSCSICFKPFCQSHLRTNFLTAKQGCINCLKPCMSCGRYTAPSKLRKSLDKDMCDACLRTSSIRINNK